jgi:RES domain-containing protein
MLEMLVHLDRDLVPPSYQLLRVSIPEDVAIETIGAELPVDWRNKTVTSRELGDRWLDRSTGPLMQVPSAISERGHNYLLNPSHPDAVQIKVAEVIKAPFDPRLLA